MDAQLFLLCVLTFVIHLIGALAYAVRIAGVRTRRIAMSFALFNVLVLLSRASNAFQGPFLSKRIESNLLHGSGGHLLGVFQWLLASASLAALVGALAIPPPSACSRAPWRTSKSTARCQSCCCTPSPRAAPAISVRRSPCPRPRI